MVWPVVAALAGGYVYAKSGDLTPSAEDIGQAAGDAAEAVFSGLGPALVGTVEGAYSAIGDAIKGREANAIAAITIGVISVSMILYGIRKLRGPAVELTA